MGKLNEHLNGLVDKEVFVVQTDGRGFKGVLREYDEDILVLDDVVETSTRELTWRRPVVAIPHSDRGDGKEESYVAILRELVIKMDHIMRIWTWSPERLEKQHKYVIRQRSQELE